MAPGRPRAQMPIRGLMLDPARLTERHEFYFDLLGDLSRWGINTLWWHFADDEGFLLRLDSHPELATRYALGKSKMRRFIRAAREVGIDVIPEVESLGHARFITSRSQYAHLADGGDIGFNAACPSHPATLRLYEDIIREVAGLFESPYMHAGLDEVDLSGCPRCARRGRGRPRWWLYAQHARAIHRIVTRCGKRMIMWADHVERAPALLKALPKDVVLAHWQYTKVRPERIAPSLAAGFQVVLCPALCHHGDVICPNAGNLQNMDDMLALATRWRRRGVIGLVNTFWTSVRGLRDAYIAPMAYTGRMLSEGKPIGKLKFCGQFLRRRFGISSASAARALWRLYQSPVGRTELAALLFDSPADMHAALNIAGSDGFAGRAEALRQCADALSAAAGSAQTRKAEFRATILAARVAAECLANAIRLRAAYEAYRRAEQLKDSGANVRAVAARLAESLRLLKRIDGSIASISGSVAREWDRTRHPRDPKKAVMNIESAPCKEDVLLGRLVRCGSYCAKLISRLSLAVADYKRGGPFPAALG